MYTKRLQEVPRGQRLWFLAELALVLRGGGFQQILHHAPSPTTQQGLSRASAVMKSLAYIFLSPIEMHFRSTQHLQG